MTTRLHNPGLYEIVYDTAGHALGGGESVEVEQTEDFTADLIARGVLIAAEAEPGIVRKKREPKTPPPAVEDTGRTKKEDK